MSKKNACYAINGLWGIGKTFVLTEVEKQLKNRYIIFHYNVWGNDYYSEPFIAILSNMIDQLNEKTFLQRFFKEIGKDFLGNTVSALSEAVGFLLEKLTGIDVVKEGREIIGKIKELKKMEK